MRQVFLSLIFMSSLLYRSECSSKKNILDGKVIVEVSSPVSVVDPTGKIWSSDDLASLNTEAETETEEYVIIDPTQVRRFSSRPVLAKTDFDFLDEKLRFPTAIRHIWNYDPAPANHVINSKFIRNQIINGYDLNTLMTLYELEMMNPTHSYDKDRALENYLVQAVRTENNEDMANLAIEMWAMENWAALKLIIDVKFSHESPFDAPILFKDLKYLMYQALRKHVPSDFCEKVLELASPRARDRYRNNPSFGNY